MSTWQRAFVNACWSRQSSFINGRKPLIPAKPAEEIGSDVGSRLSIAGMILTSAFCQVLTQMDAETADGILLDEMVYLIARANEAEGFIQETTSHPQWFECLCRRAAASNENEAKWQFAAYLPECPCSQEVKDMILDFAKDPNEYVSRRALLAMPALRPDCVEQFAPLFWERNCYSLELTGIPADRCSGLAGRHPFRPASTILGTGQAGWPALSAGTRRTDRRRTCCERKTIPHPIQSNGNLLRSRR